MNHPPLLFCVDGNAGLAEGLVRELGAEAGEFAHRQFPDGESYVRLLSDCKDRHVLLVCSLDRPDSRSLPLWFLADTARELGAASVGLVAPYLAYMRQDTRFAPGEAVNARLYASYLAPHFDWLVTVDPHLHRYASLAEVYTLPHRVVAAAPLLAAYVRERISHPLLIGPDAESEQWVAAVAAAADAPYRVLRKERLGDRRVRVSLPEPLAWDHHRPVLVDDIIASGHTLLETIAQLRAAGARAPVCLAVHGLFADQAYERLLTAGAAHVVTSNSIVHVSNALDLSAALAGAVRELCPAFRTT
ncbi:MAG: ribose-phosphate diphosphokinase [Gammaproteobacteria bacterium]|nr:ribose-phosphate diphosphokinase [Gammaproteobacteria bacterium]